MMTLMIDLIAVFVDRDAKLEKQVKWYHYRENRDQQDAWCTFNINPTFNTEGMIHKKD